MKRGQAAIKSPSAIARRLRGQAAIEYLSTYGWAILIMLVAIVLLLWLGIISPKTPLQSSCIFPSDFVCRGYILNTTGNYKLDIGQATGHPINVTKIKCTAATSPGTLDTITSVAISNGDHAIVTDGSQQCYDKDGTTVADGRAGDMYKGRIFVEYVEVDTTFTHQIVGDVTLKYEEVGLD